MASRRISMAGQPSGREGQAQSRELIGRRRPRVPRRHREHGFSGRSNRTLADLVSEPGHPEPEVSWVHDYPTQLSCEVATSNGPIVHLRPIRPDDGDGLLRFHQGLSARSVYRRFFSVHPVLSAAEVQRFTHVDYVDRLALVVEEDDRLIAVGRYERLPGSSDAEVAFVVADACQHRGIGPLLLKHLVVAAVKTGITAFVAQTLAENRDMLDVFRHSGFPVATTSEDGTVSVRFPIVPDEVS
jgi:GNAT superfamily N-acetyltransferase